MKGGWRNSVTDCVESGKILLPLNSECAGSTLALENISRELATAIQ